MQCTNAVYKCSVQMQCTNAVYKCSVQMQCTNAPLQVLSLVSAVGAVVSAVVGGSN